MLNPIEGEPRDFSRSHRKFEVGKKHELSSEDAKVLSAIKERLAQGKNWSPEFNQRLGKIFIERLSSFGFGIKNGAEREQSLTEIKRLEAFYRAIFPDEKDFIIFYNGFRAEYAVARSLQKNGFEVYYPSVQEDLKKGLDWWVAGGRVERPIALQVKCLSMREDPRGHMVIPVNLGNYEETTGEVLDWFGHAIRDEVGMARSIKHLADYCRQSSVGSSVVCVFLPSSESRFAYFSPETGEPGENLDYQLTIELTARLGKETDYGQAKSAHGQ